MRARISKWLPPIGKVLLFLFLLALPSAVRIGYYYMNVPGLHAPAHVPRPDHAAVDVPTVEKAPWPDLSIRQEQKGKEPALSVRDAFRAKGRVIVDRAHDNTLYDPDLNVLLAHLTARSVESVSITADSSLADALREATALVVIAPHQPFSSEQVRAVGRFVERGGRVLLIADPGRYAWAVAYDPAYGEYRVLHSDAAAINSLAAQFGLAFSDDYIYNTTENAGNYQYVILTDWIASPLTAGLEKVVFYSAHSIASGPQALIIADEQTISSLSEQGGGLVMLSLGGNGRVLAVPDLTFMTEPYNATADNNRLIANIADFVAGAERTYGLADFPLFLGEEVDVVPLVDAVDPEAVTADEIARLSLLKRTLEEAGKTLHWQEIGYFDPQGAKRDTIYVGLYGSVASWPQVGDILSSQGISFTLETIELPRATPTPTPRLTATPAPTPRSSLTPTPTERPPKDWIHFDDKGQVEAKEVALFYQNEEQGRQVLIVLAFSQEGLQDAAQRLIAGDLDGCLLDEDMRGDPAVASLALCPVSYDETPPESPAADLTPTQAPGPDTSEAEAGAVILVVADNDGQGVYDWWTSADDFASAASDAGYEVVVWSTFLDGEVTLDTIQSYDGLIWCTGDFQEPGFTPEEKDFENIMSYLGEGGRVILCGGFIGSAEDRQNGLLADIQVARAEHPLAQGFAADQIIALSPSVTTEGYVFPTLEEACPECNEGMDQDDRQTTVFVRGPGSEFAGSAIVAVDQDPSPGRVHDSPSRALVIGFPIYLLPEQERYQLATNAVLWLMED